MVTLSRIYTRTGDKGKTRLGDSSQVAKTDPRIEACGCVDELNAVLGLALTTGMRREQVEILKRVQNELFDLGADLCKPLAEGDASLRIQPEQLTRLEEEIDQINSTLTLLKSFVLPGGNPGAAWLHLGRTVCRRAERRAWSLAGQAEVNELALSYLNRLSDLLFVMARAENQGGERDVLWEPGKTQQDGQV
jgi:cob(I)alamin adenosyltransferase